MVPPARRPASRRHLVREELRGAARRSGGRAPLCLCRPRPAVPPPRRHVCREPRARLGRGAEGGWPRPRRAAPGGWRRLSRLRLRAEAAAAARGALRPGRCPPQPGAGGGLRPWPPASPLLEPPQSSGPLGGGGSCRLSPSAGPGRGAGRAAAPRWVPEWPGRRGPCRPGPPEPGGGGRHHHVGSRSGGFLFSAKSLVCAGLDGGPAFRRVLLSCQGVPGEGISAHSCRGWRPAIIIWLKPCFIFRTFSAFNVSC